jgi:HAD superfamily hydrolase (TIGR01549 family)
VACPGLAALLLDLDDTLLHNPMDVFLPAYFRALTRSVACLVPPEQLMAELVRGVQAMDANEGTGLTNEESFAAVFYPALGQEREDLEPAFDRFYADEFPKLQTLTRRLPEARPLVEWALARGLQVAIATNPLFPSTAIEQRLAWAGLAVTEIDYTLVTTYENSHATKANPAYYREIVASLGREPQECLMVGDDWQRDVVPAAAVGIPVYWIAPPGETPPAADVALAGQGTLADLWDWLRRAISR